jgi:general secretion pathway protein H
MHGTAGAARARHAGFTLLELLIAMSIVGVLSAMLVVISTPGESALARTEARRLAALLELALAEAHASGQGIAWSSERSGYSFWHRADDGEWVRFPDGSEFRRRSLPGATQLRDVLIDARELPEGERVVLSPYGFGGALEATMSGGSASFAIRAGVIGRVSVQPDFHAGTEVRRPAAGPRVHPG